MPLSCTQCLIILCITAATSAGDFPPINKQDGANPFEENELEKSLHLFKPKSVNRLSHLQPKLKRSRRSTSDGTQIPGSVCPGCSSSNPPYFSEHCFLCAPGTPGPRGPPGQQGIPGRDGRDGRDAMNERGDVEMIEDPDPQEDSTLKGNKTGGAVYVRWGRNECSSQSELIYAGIAGGGHFTHKGSGANYLCMPESPIYDEPVAGSSSQRRGYIYGAEYESNTYAMWNDIDDNNVYCAVCWAENRPSMIMIPARNICPGPEWTKEYSGYLVSEYYNHGGRTEYVCMDRNPEAIPGSEHNANGALFYPVEGRCGSIGSGLPCGPYVDGYELTCAVCTR